MMLKKHFRKKILYFLPFFGTLKKSSVWGKIDIHSRALKLKGYRQTSKLFSKIKTSDEIDVFVYPKPDHSLNSFHIMLR